MAAEFRGIPPMPFWTVRTASAGGRTDRARLGEKSRDGVDTRQPGCRVCVMSVAVPAGPPVQTALVPPSVTTPGRVSALRPRRGRRMAAHAAVPTRRAMMPFLRWLTFVLAGNVVTALLLVSGRSAPSALTSTVTAASINIGLAVLVRQQYFVNVLFWMAT